MKNFWNYCKKLFSKKTEFYIRPEHPYEIAFVHQGTEYYRFKDPFNIPATRALCALDFYKELEMGCDRDFLLKHTEAAEKLINDPKQIRLGDLALLIKQLRERIEFVKDKQLYLKLASVLYFDKSENPYIYDYAYGREKMKRWENDEEMLDFFLQHHLAILIPSSIQSPINSRTYFHVNEKISP